MDESPTTPASRKKCRRRWTRDSGTMLLRILSSLGLVGRFGRPSRPSRAFWVDSASTRASALASASAFALASVCAFRGGKKKDLLQTDVTHQAEPGIYLR